MSALVEVVTGETAATPLRPRGRGSGLCRNVGKDGQAALPSVQRSSCCVEMLPPAAPFGGGLVVCCGRLGGRAARSSLTFFSLGKGIKMFSDPARALALCLEPTASIEPSPGCGLLCLPSHARSRGFVSHLTPCVPRAAHENLLNCPLGCLSKKVLEVKGNHPQTKLKSHSK